MPETSASERRYTQRESITESERLQLIGLVTLGRSLQAQQDAVERAMLAITQETTSFGQGGLADVGEGGHTWDAISQRVTTDVARDVDEMLRKLDLPVDDTKLSPDEAEQTLRTVLAAATEPSPGLDYIESPGNRLLGIAEEVRRAIGDDEDEG